MRLSKADRIFFLVDYIVLSVILIFILYPLIYIVSSSFSSTRAVVAGSVWLWPVEFNLAGYKAVFKNSQVWTGYLNSFIYTILGTSINLMMTVMAAYPLSRKDFWGRNAIMMYFTFTILFSGGLIPTFLLVKSLNLLDTRWAMVVPSAMGVWNVILTKTYFQNTIPDELHEAGELDGCSDIRFLLSIVLPLSGPILAVMTLFCAIGYWNAYFDALIYLTKANLYPLQIILRNILIQNQIDATMIADVDEIMAREGMKDLLKYSLIVVASAPVIVLYPFIQRYFVKGIMIGSIKG